MYAHSPPLACGSANAGDDDVSDGCSSTCTVEPGFVCTGTDCDDDDIDVNPGALARKLKSR